MFWIIYCAFFGLMLLSIFRMLNQRGKWAWALFLGLIASALAYVLVFVLPVASAPALQEKPTLRATIVIAGTAIYIGALFVFTPPCSKDETPNSPVMSSRSSFHDAASRYRCQNAHEKPTCAQKMRP